LKSDKKRPLVFQFEGHLDRVYTEIKRTEKESPCG